MFKFFQKPIFLSLSPNFELDDVFLALKILFQPWIWKKESSFLEEEFKKFFNVRYAFAFNSGRSALMAILNSLDLEKKSEILILAFTCNTLVNPILWSGFRPIFVDCNPESLNFDIEDLKRKINKKSKVLILQHTFGLPENLKEILEICQNENLILIEDCAHSLGATFFGKKVGTFGKASFFSFGRDKVISSVFGGMAITNDPLLGEKINKFLEKCKMPSFFWIFQQLLYLPLMEFLIKPTYNFFKIGRFLLFLFQKTKLLSKAITKEEKIGKNPSIFPQKMPRALALLAENQFKKLEKFNLHRKKISQIYQKSLKDLKIKLPKEQEGRIWFKYSLFFEKKSKKILEELKKENIFLDNGWRENPIFPPGTDQEKMEYKIGSCPNAESVSQRILNLPTHIQISEEDAEKIVFCLKEIIKENGN